jgi:hypothetical protein
VVATSDTGFSYRSTWTDHMPKAMIRAGRSRIACSPRSALTGAGGEGRPPELTAGATTRRWAKTLRAHLSR